MQTNKEGWKKVKMIRKDESMLNDIAQTILGEERKKNQQKERKKEKVIFNNTLIDIIAQT